MPFQLTPQRGVNILRNMTGNAEIPFEEPVAEKNMQSAGPVRRGYQGTAQPVQPRPQQFAGPAQRGYGGAMQLANNFTRQPVFAPQQQRFDAAQRMSQRMFAALQDQGFNQDLDLTNLNARQRAQLTPQQQAAFQARQQLEQLYGQFGGQRVPMFNGNSATPSQQMLAGMQGNRAQMPRQRPFASFYAGARQGRGGRQPVASPQDAAFRQRLQESATSQNRFTNFAGNNRIRPMQRRPVFA